MSLRINNNITSLNAQRNLQNNDLAVGRSLERLSSGLRINRAADDAAGLVISEQMRAQITGLNQAIANSETAVSMVQTAEGALDEVNSLLLKARQLALHAANEGANDTNQLIADQNELDNVIDAISRISDFTQFGTKKLLDGSLNGATNLGAGVERVEVGNLANNAAVATGRMDVDVSGFSRENNFVTSTGAFVNGTSGMANRLFNDDFSGMNLNGVTLSEGATASLTIDGTTRTITAGASGLTAQQIATEWNDRFNDFTVTYNSDDGGFDIESTSIGPNEFTSSITFTRAAEGGTPDQAAYVDSTLTIPGPNTANSVNAFFGTGVADLSGVTASTEVSTGTTFRFILTDQNNNILQGTINSGSTMEENLGFIQDAIRAGSLGALSSAALTGATLEFLEGVNGGFDVRLRLGDNEETRTFSFSLTMDFENAPETKASVKDSSVTNIFSGSGPAPEENATFLTSTGGIITDLSDGHAASGITIQEDVVLRVNVNGVDFSYTVTGGGATMAFALEQLQTAINTTPGVSSGLAGAGEYQIGFGSGGVLGGASGTLFGSGSEFAGLSGTTATAGNIFMANNDGFAFSFALSFDQLGGSDALANINNEVQAGEIASATSNLETTAQNYEEIQEGTVSLAEVTYASTLVETTAGQAGSATMTDSQGAEINLRLDSVNSAGIATYTLEETQTLEGLQNFKIELSQSLSQSGGSTRFDLDNGAVFQVGANAAQSVDVTIRSMFAEDLGRNAAGAGTLTSLQDMLSTQQGALLNGMADEALAVIDQAIDEVSDLRGALGAFQANTLETGMNSLRISRENLTSAESVIRDVDFAAESAAFTRNQIMVQSSTAMLAQANQLPQNVLQLLG